MTTGTRMAVANGSDENQRTAAGDANAAQDGVNIVDIVGTFHRHLLALHRSGVCGDNLVNHQVALSFVSKLNSLCRMSFEQKIDALGAVRRSERGESVNYSVIPL